MAPGSGCGEVGGQRGPGLPGELQGVQVLLMEESDPDTPSLGVQTMPGPPVYPLLCVTD